MAAKLVQMIRGIQPFGPYRIAGWSFGGTLAYEVAHQIIGAGENISFLGLFDATYAPHYMEQSNGSPHMFSLPFNSSQALKMLVLTRLFSEERTAVSERIATSVAKDSFTQTVAALNKQDLIPYPYSLMSAEELRTGLHRDHIFSKALFGYCAQPLPIDLHVFIAADTATAEPFKGWEDVVPQKQMHRHLVPGTHHLMMDDPNVPILANLLSGLLLSSSEPASHIYRKASLNTIQRSATQKYPLLLVPGAGMAITSFLDLVQELKHDGSIFGLQPPSLEHNVSVPYSNVETAATDYLQAMGKTFATPPAIIGYSFGGWVAFEIALRLQNVGAEAPALLLVDTEPPDNDPAVVHELTHLEVLSEWIRACELSGGVSLGIDDALLRSRSHATQLSLIHRRMVAAKMLPSRSTPEILYAPIRNLAASLRTTYAPKAPYMGEVLLVSAEDPMRPFETAASQQEDVLTRWRKFAPRLTNKRLFANHFQLLKVPYVHELAQIIKDGLPQ
ncbi:thioesterase domain-containing protein [Granulicella aggregans]|uniref:Thioesterase domain-containing protein n=2 Tax=Granulicella aggregans TaxID=474949 RepID=A0A7W8E4A3_9BACT|nr:thioesterase domain-containing protein [Granulicella aggregans]